MGSAKEIFKRFLIKFKIGGKAFDPYYQERTDALDDLVRSKENVAKDKAMLDKMFNIQDDKNADVYDNQEDKK